jgi:hypothetical protein
MDLTSSRSDDLGELLDDVRRLVNGLDDVMSLCVEGTVARARRRPVQLTDLEILAYTRLLGAASAAAAVDATTAVVSVPCLRAVLDALARIGE